MPRRIKKAVSYGGMVLAALVMTSLVLVLKDRVVSVYYVYRLDDEVEAGRAAAARRLGELGATNSIPALIELLKTAPGEIDSEWESKSGTALVESGIALAAMGRESINPLVAILRNESNDTQKWRACVVLEKIGAPAVRALIELVADAQSDPSLRLDAGHAEADRSGCSRIRPYSGRSLPRTCV